MAMIKCKACKQEKDESEYYASSKTKCKACVLERQKALKEARAAGKAPSGRKARGKSTNKANASKMGKASAEVKPADSRWEQPGGFGFAVELQVDENTRQTDVHLEQKTPDLGEQNIWLSQYEARSLRAWLDEKLGPL